MTDEELFKIWNQAGDDNIPVLAKDKSFAETEEKIRDLEYSEKRPRRITRRIAFRILAVAASVALVAISSIEIYRLYVDDFGRGEPIALAEPVEYVEYSAASGEMKTVTLPDSSKVTINSGSVLICPKEFRESKRDVFLNGEAIFDVAHDDDKQFVVSTSSFKILVHGTKFNVSAYSSDDIVSAVLCRGSLSVTGISDKEYYLVPNQRLSLDRRTGSVEINPIDSDDAVSWSTNGLCFISESFHDIIRVLKRHYGVEIYLADDRYDDSVITAKFFHGESLNEVMIALSRLIPGMEYHIGSDGSIYIH